MFAILFLSFGVPLILVLGLQLMVFVTDFIYYKLVPALSRLRTGERLSVIVLFLSITGFLFGFCKYDIAYDAIHIAPVNAVQSIY